jgi:hypothetical protein
VQLPKDTINWDDTEAKTAFPDIIVHKRNTQVNLLVIEIKKLTDNENRSTDYNKLVCFTSNDFGYNYGLGLFLELSVNNDPDIFRWFKKGQVVSEYSVAIKDGRIVRNPL